MEKNGTNFLKLLAVINIIYVLLPVLASMKSYSSMHLSNVLITVTIHLFFRLGLIYGIYQKKNGGRILLSGVCNLRLMACLNLFINGRFGISQIMSVVYAVLCLIILSRVEVIDYIRSSV